MAPCFSVLRPSGTTRSRSRSAKRPKPLHAGHAPTAELKLKRCGDGGSISVAHVAQRKLPVARNCQNPAEAPIRANAFLLQRIKQPRALRGIHDEAILQHVDRHADAIIGQEVSQRLRATRLERARVARSGQAEQGCLGGKGR